MRGKVHVFGNDLNTDEIIPARYLNTIDPATLAAHCMEDADPEFVKRARPGDLIVAGRNFGCGSSRSTRRSRSRRRGSRASWPRVSCIFFRNAINMGLPIITCPEAVRDAHPGDEMEIDLAGGALTNRSTGHAFTFPPFTREIQEIIAAGGLMAFVKGQVAR